jgi:(p)ppGpp synthase/HD superfamily hydrolase
MDSVVQEALVFSIKAHEGQTRKDKKTPFVVHPIMVAMNCARHGMDDEEIAIALLHDVIEDTEITIKELQKHFSNKICKGVDSLTCYSGMKKTKYLNNIIRNKYHIRCIKSADRIHNLSDSEDQELSWRKKYSASTIKYILVASEKTPFHEELQKEINRVLLKLLED